MYRARVAVVVVVMFSSPWVWMSVSYQTETCTTSDTSLPTWYRTTQLCGGPLGSMSSDVTQMTRPQQHLVHIPCRVVPASLRRELWAAYPYTYPRRPGPLPVLFLVPRARPLSPLVRLGRGAIFGPLVW